MIIALSLSNCFLNQVVKSPTSILINNNSFTSNQVPISVSKVTQKVYDNKNTRVVAYFLVNIDNISRICYIDHKISKICP